MAKGKILSVRVEPELAADLEAFAQFDGVAVAEQVRRAIELLLESRRRDPEFRTRVREALERSQKLLAELGEDDVAAAFDLEDEADTPQLLAARRHH